MIVTSYCFLNMASFSKRALVLTLSYKNNFSFTRKLNTLSGELFCTRPRFYKETWLTLKSFYWYTRPFMALDLLIFLTF